MLGHSDQESDGDVIENFDASEDAIDLGDLLLDMMMGMTCLTIFPYLTIVVLEHCD